MGNKGCLCQGFFFCSFSSFFFSLKPQVHHLLSTVKNLLCISDLSWTNVLREGFIRFSCRKTKQTSRIGEYQVGCSNWIRLSTRWDLRYLSDLHVLTGESSHLTGRRWLIATSMQTTEVFWWKYCLVWKESRMWERCLSTSRLRVSQTADDIAYQRLPQRFKPWIEILGTKLVWTCWCFCWSFYSPDITSQQTQQNFNVPAGWQRRFPCCYFLPNPPGRSP